MSTVSDLLKNVRDYLVSSFMNNTAQEESYILAEYFSELEMRIGKKD